MCKGNGRSVAKENEPLPGHQDGWAEVLHRRASSAFYWSWVCPTLPQRIKPHVMLSFHTQHTPNILLINTELCANGFCHQFSDWYTSVEDVDKLVLENFIHPRQSQRKEISATSAPKKWRQSKEYPLPYPVSGFMKGLSGFSQLEGKWEWDGREKLSVRE